MPRPMSYTARAILATGMLLATQTAVAQTTTFRKVADTNTPIPGGTGTFASFATQTFPGRPSIDNGNVAFVGINAAGQRGVYTEINGMLSVVADANTPIPGGTGNFTGFSIVPWIDGGRVAFLGVGNAGQLGVYTNVGGPLRVVADTNTPIPGGSGTFDGFDSATTDGQNVTFLGNQGYYGIGIYLDNNGSLSVVADTNTPVPGSSENFTGFHVATIDSGEIALLGIASGFETGYYTKIGGTFAAVATGNTPIPGGTGTFDGFFVYSSISNGKIAFQAGLIFEEIHGVYTDLGGPLRVVADGNTPIPGGNGNFLPHFGALGPSIDNGNIAFSGEGNPISGSPQSGIYEEVAGSLRKVIDLNDTLDGKTLLPFDVPTSPQALSGNDIVFYATFTDGSEGIFVANTQSDQSAPTVPAVSAWGLVVLVLALLVLAKIPLNDGRNRRAKPMSP